MSITDDDRKTALIEQAVSAASGQADPGQDEFVRECYRHMPPADVVSQDPADLSAAARSLWHFGAEREPGKPKIRVLPPGANGAWPTDRSVVQIINDDMRFLLASVTAALAGMGLDVRLVIHPALNVVRSGARRLSAAPDGAGIGESMMQIELAGDVGEDRGTAIVSRLTAVLADVRSAVEAWPDMRAALGQMTAGAMAAPVPAGEASETAAFLQWLDDNFMFLGYREYNFGNNGPGIVAGAGRGLLRRDDFQVFDGLQVIAQASPNVQAFLAGPQLLLITKSSSKSSVYRPVPMDTVIVKTFEASGKTNGLKLLLGLFTAASYFHAPHEIPVLRNKVRQCLQRSGFPPVSHDGQALRRILDSFPRDELFQIDEPQLYETALGILYLKQRPRIRLFVLRDPFERFATCLVYLPRDRYNAEIRQRFSTLLEQAFAGTVVNDSTTFDEALACLHLVLATTTGQVTTVNVAELEQQLTEAARTWADRLSESLVQAQGERSAAETLRCFAAAFPAGYVERYATQDVVQDIARVQQVANGDALTLNLMPVGTDLRLKTYHSGEPVALSDILPMLENLGVRVMNEIPFEVSPRGERPVWIQEFQLRSAIPIPAEDTGALRLFEAALLEVWSGVSENDGFNRLVLSAELSARQIVVLRAYCKLLRQAGSSYSQAYMETTFSAHPNLARMLVKLFETQFAPASQSADTPAQEQAIHDEIIKALEQVENLDEDRIIRSYLLLIEKSLRTNYYQHEAGLPKSYLSIKVASHEIDLLPLPRPLVEIFVYSPRMEGCHLRGGKVARGGIRWSDRREDFRTEVLGLMKAQMVKNAVIVPVGSKGGFVVKCPPAGGRDALIAEGIACYKLLMCGLLDLTDNFHGAEIVPPVDVVRRDPDDPYLVVAADKGTATFSDIANGVSIDYGFWLGDAFASGGSVGYDHKAMGITAKGAWEAVKRHFREIGTDIQTTDFSCVGVGDMSGDVFGNGMLLSRHTRLIAAFNHMHILIDPDPDPATSWTERKRLFDLPRSTWGDYAAGLLSKGGAVYERKAKAIHLSPEACQRLGIEQESLSPQQLIQALLRQNVDLLWFGGIGTYVKAISETNADAGDRANDSLRVDAKTLRARVVGEGANLATTQRGRIEYALSGGRINTDAIDNSAGVDTSDHEVNIKIGVGDLIASGHIEAKHRSPFLAAMTAEVEQLVLADNYLQTLAVTLAEAQAPQSLDQHIRLMRAMERSGRLDRAVEFLPDDDALIQRAAAGRGLTRPEIAVLQAYAKNGLYGELLSSDLPDQPELRTKLLDYFPHAMHRLAPDVLAKHRLRREIIATTVANALVNRLGPAFIEETQIRTGRDPASIVRAYLIVCNVFELASVWRSIEALDNKVPATAQTQLLLSVASVIDQAVRWFLLSGQSLDISARTQQFQPGVHKLAAHVAELQGDSEQRLNATRREAYVASGAPADLADRILVLNALSTAMDIVEISEGTGRDIIDLARLYFGAGVSLGLLMLRRQARIMPAATEWQRLVVDTLVDDSYVQQRALVRHLVADGVDGSGDGLEKWVGQRAGPGSPLQSVLTDIARASPPDLAMLTVASQRIRAVVS